VELVVLVQRLEDDVEGQVTSRMPGTTSYGITSSVCWRVTLFSMVNSNERISEVAEPPRVTVAWLKL
jgi:hypothetical protein